MSAKPKWKIKSLKCYIITHFGLFQYRKLLRYRLPNSSLRYLSFSVKYSLNINFEQKKFLISILANLVTKCPPKQLSELNCGIGTFAIGQKYTEGYQIRMKMLCNTESEGHLSITTTM